jgi:hypothetical protein
MQLVRATGAYACAERARRQQLFAVLDHELQTSSGGGHPEEGSRVSARREGGPAIARLERASRFSSHLFEISAARSSSRNSDHFASCSRWSSNGTIEGGAGAIADPGVTIAVRRVAAMIEGRRGIEGRRAIEDRRAIVDRKVRGAMIAICGICGGMTASPTTRSRAGASLDSRTTHLRSSKARPTRAARNAVAQRDRRGRGTRRRPIRSFSCTSSWAAKDRSLDIVHPYAMCICAGTHMHMCNDW